MAAATAAALKALKRRARELAEAEYVPPRGAPACVAEIRKRTRNRSAFVSRQTARHYQRLLAAHVQRVEDERDRQLRDCHQVAGEVATLRRRADLLAALVQKRGASAPK